MNNLITRVRRVTRRLTTRLLVTYLLLVTLSVGGLILWTGTRLEVATFDQEEHNLEIQAQLIASSLRQTFGEDEHERGSKVATLTALIQAYANEGRAAGNLEPIRVTVVDKDMRVLASTDPRMTAGVEENYPEIAAARLGVPQPSIRHDELAGEERIFVAAPVRGEEEAFALVQLSMSSAPLYASLRDMWLGLIGVGGAVVGVTALVSLLLARGIALPVQNLTRASEEIARGHLERRVTPTGPDEIARLGLAFNRMTDRLQELITREQEFAANAAHELRSPLTSLRLRLELLQNPAVRESAETTHYLEEMEREVGDLQRVIEQLLALAALDQNEPAPRTTLDPAPLLYELADQLSPLVRQARVTLLVEVPLHLPIVNVNADQLAIVVRNLLDNALKYTPPGGCVTLRAGERNGALEIAVADTGEGIPPNALPHVFDRFYRVGTARAKRVRGSGLGLALARSLIEANGGCIQAQSTPGEGSTFAVYLPLSPSGVFLSTSLAQMPEV